MEWSTNRRFLYGVFILLAIGLLSAYPIYFFTYKAPTCFDAKQNGNEVGVDCGGGCALYCPLQVEPLRVVWARAFMVSPGNYDVAAYIENPNIVAGIKNARYTFNVLDGEGKNLATLEGSTEITPGTPALIFEGDVAFPHAPKDVNIIFNNTDLALWTNARSAPSYVVMKNQILKNTSTKPRFEVMLLNTDLVNDAPLLHIGAIIYSPERNPVAVSRTVVDGIGKGGSQNIVFTWPNTFAGRQSGSCESVDNSLLVGGLGNGDNVVATTTPDCKKESFLAEIVITPRAIFVE